MLTEEKITDLEHLGFRRWQKGSHDRLYISAYALGLETTHYKTGNISGATFNGERISNRQARRYEDAQTYIDVKTGIIHGREEVLRDAARGLAFTEVDE